MLTVFIAMLGAMLLAMLVAVLVAVLFGVVSHMRRDTAAQIAPESVHHRAAIIFLLYLCTFENRCASTGGTLTRRLFRGGAPSDSRARRLHTRLHTLIAAHESDATLYSSACYGEGSSGCNMASLDQLESGWRGLSRGSIVSMGVTAQVHWCWKRPRWYPSCLL